MLPSGNGKLVRADSSLVFTDDDEDQLFALEINSVSVVLIHRALKQYYEQWPGGDPWEQAEIQTLKRYFYKLTLEVTMNVPASE